MGRARAEGQFPCALPLTNGLKLYVNTHSVHVPPVPGALCRSSAHCVPVQLVSITFPLCQFFKLRFETLCDSIVQSGARPSAVRNRDTIAIYSVLLLPGPAPGHLKAAGALSKAFYIFLETK